jgi:hypothetical protein
MWLPLDLIQSAHAEIQFALHNATTGDPVDKYLGSSSSINRLSAQGAFIHALDGRLRSQQIKVVAIHAGSGEYDFCFLSLGSK